MWMDDSILQQTKNSPLLEFVCHREVRDAVLSFWEFVRVLESFTRVGDNLGLESIYFMTAKKFLWFSYTFRSLESLFGANSKVPGVVNRSFLNNISASCSIQWVMMPWIVNF